MVKFSDVQQGIEKLETETGALLVDYNRTHRYSHAEKSEYDWKCCLSLQKSCWVPIIRNCC